MLLFGGASAQGTLLLHLKFAGCLLLRCRNEGCNTLLLAGVNICSDFQIEQFIDRVRLNAVTEVHEDKRRLYYLAETPPTDLIFARKSLYAYDILLFSIPDVKERIEVVNNVI